jgi:hypothetical protein
MCRGRRAHLHGHHHLPAPLHKKSHGLVLLASSRSQGGWRGRSSNIS